MINNLKKFLNEDQDPKAVEKIAGKLNGLLMNGEEVEYIAIQKKPAVNISPDCVALTNKRVIFLRPKNLGLSMDFQDYIWKDVLDCHIRESLFGSEFTLRTVKGSINKIDYLPKSQARKLYINAQEQEEKQKEIRRQLDLEEKRAIAGNVTLNAGQNFIPKQTEINTTEDPMASLKKLKSLFENELISQEEYDNKKAEILSKL